MWMQALLLMARGKMPPNLAVGDKITFTFETEPTGGVQLTNRLVNWEGGIASSRVIRRADQRCTEIRLMAGSYTVPDKS